MIAIYHCTVYKLCCLFDFVAICGLIIIIMKLYNIMVFWQTYQAKCGTGLGDYEVIPLVSKCTIKRSICLAEDEMVVVNDLHTNLHEVMELTRLELFKLSYLSLGAKIIHSVECYIGKC